MGVNDGFLETFIFHIRHDVFKVTINFTKGMYTVYTSDGRILVRKEKMSQMDLRKVKKEIQKYIDGEIMVIYPFHSFRGFRIA